MNQITWSWCANSHTGQPSRLNGFKSNAQHPTASSSYRAVNSDSCGLLVNFRPFFPRQSRQTWRHFGTQNVAKFIMIENFLQAKNIQEHYDLSWFMMITLLICNTTATTPQSRSLHVHALSTQQFRVKQTSTTSLWKASSISSSHHHICSEIFQHLPTMHVRF